jgi:hypothetical protein
VRWTLAILVLAGTAAADPVHDRVVVVPTAEMPAALQVITSAALDRHGAPQLDTGLGLGDIAEVELALADTDARGQCATECEAIDRVTAGFRIGARQDAWFAGMPALVFGVRTTIGGSYNASEGYLVATRRIGLVTLHAGVAIQAVATDPPRAIRPLAGLELRPPAFPKTTLLADLSWQPTFAATPRTDLAFAWGVRYQTFTWGALELLVRHDQSSFGDPDVLVRATVITR